MPRGTPGSTPPCKAPGCDNLARKHGFCVKHDYRWRRYGDPLAVRQIVGDDEARIRSKIKKTPRHWEWTGTIHRGTGYGCFRVPGHQLLAHRVVWELLVGPIPEGLTLDHIKERCDLRSCVKVLADEHGPAHLEPVTRGENSLRGDGPTARNARKTHCPAGHPYDPEKRYGQRICSECRRTPKRK
jgi:HNH endonuclease